MSNLQKMDRLHDEAMELTDMALFQKSRGELDLARETFQKAFALESDAAKIVEPLIDEEPTRSILFRSAATLACDCDAIDEAKKLVLKGLAGKPPAKIESELYELLEKITF